jgi:hypothetical protein
LGVGMQNKIRRSKDPFKQFIKLFKEIDVEGIAERTKVDEFSKKSIANIQYLNGLPIILHLQPLSDPCRQEIMTG